MSEIADLLPFTAHNIRLADGTRTIPDRDDLLEDHRWTRGALRALNSVLDPGQIARIADLGCLEGGYSIEFGRRGHEVVGIDARWMNVRRSEAARRDLGLDNVRFVVGDAKDVADHGEFDVVFCHLNRGCCVVSRSRAASA